MNTPTIEETMQSATLPEHIDVLIVGAGLSGIGAAHYLQTECPWAGYAIFEARDSHRRHLGSLSLSRYPLGLGHAHPRVFLPALGRREVDRRRRLHPPVHQGHRGRGRHRPAHPFRPPHHRCRLVRRRCALADHGATRGRHDLRAHRGLPLLLHRLLPLRPWVPARLRRHERLRPARSSTPSSGPRTSTTSASGSWSSEAAPPR